MSQSYQRWDHHFMWSSEPHKSLAAGSAKGVTSFLSYFKTLSIGPAPGIKPTTSSSAGTCSTDWANTAVANNDNDCIKLTLCHSSLYDTQCLHWHSRTFPGSVSLPFTLLFLHVYSFFLCINCEYHKSLIYFTKMSWSGHIFLIPFINSSQMPLKCLTLFIAKFVVSHCALCKLQWNFGFSGSINHFSEGGVYANHSVMCLSNLAENDSRLLKNSKGNREDERILYPRKEADVALLLQVTR